jgi:hypothetical protein
LVRLPAVCGGARTSFSFITIPALLAFFFAMRSLRTDAFVYIRHLPLIGPFAPLFSVA